MRCRPVLVDDGIDVGLYLLFIERIDPSCLSRASSACDFLSDRGERRRVASRQVD
jgi:hypothetical protein